MESKDDIRPLFGKSFKELENTDKPPEEFKVDDYEYPTPTLKEQLDALSDEERYELFCNYCRHCGSKDTSCQCWNDE